MAEYRPAESTRWAVENTGVLLINAASGATRFLGYPQAAIWDLVARGDSRARVADKLCAIAGLTREEADALAAEVASMLCAEGFLEAEAPVG